MAEIIVEPMTDEQLADLDKFLADPEKQWIGRIAVSSLRERLRRTEVEALKALKPFAEFAEAHDDPNIGLQPDLGDDYVWLCPSPGYPQITTRDFRRSRAFLKEPTPATAGKE